MLSVRMEDGDKQGGLNNMRLKSDGHIDFMGYGVPEHTRDALERYLLQGIPPGSFLAACLTGNVRAVLYADHINKACFHV